MSLWGATVITNLLSAIPVFGQDIVEFVWGGFSVNNATLNRFFSLHYLLPFVLAALAIAHVIALHEHGSNNPNGVASNGDRIAFHPYFIFKDLVTIFAFFLALSIIVFFYPNVLGHSDNYIPADPMVTPASIVPEWYLLPFYAILRSIPNKLLGVIAMFGSLLILLVLPFTDLSRIRGNTFRPAMKLAFWFFVVDFIILMWIGSQHPSTPFVEIGQVATAFYFSWFLIIVPLIGLVENTLFDTALDNKKKLLNTPFLGALFHKGIALAKRGVSLRKASYNTFPFFGITINLKTKIITNIKKFIDLIYKEYLNIFYILFFLVILRYFIKNYIFGLDAGLVSLIISILISFSINTFFLDSFKFSRFIPLGLIQRFLIYSLFLFFVLSVYFFIFPILPTVTDGLYKNMLPSGGIDRIPSPDQTFINSPLERNELTSPLQDLLLYSFILDVSTLILILIIIIVLLNKFLLIFNLKFLYSFSKKYLPIKISNWLNKNINTGNEFSNKFLAFIVILNCFFIILFILLKIFISSELLVNIDSHIAVYNFLFSKKS